MIPQVICTSNTRILDSASIKTATKPVVSALNKVSNFFLQKLKIKKKN